MVELDDLIQHTRDLRPLAATAVRLAGMVQSPTVDLTDVSEVVAFDQALTMRLLKAANSAALGGVQRFTVASEAVIRLGVARVLSIAVAGSVREPLQRDVAAYGLAEGELWSHSVATAAAAEVLCEAAGVDLPPETFTAALLHDIGKLVMGRHLSDEDLEWIHQAQVTGGRGPLEAEMEVLGVHHGELGGIVAQHWEMPERVVLGIIHHHTPSQGRDVICDAVCVANHIAKHVQSKPCPPPPPECFDRLSLWPARFEDLIASTRERFESVSARYAA